MNPPEVRLSFAGPVVQGSRVTGTVRVRNGGPEVERYELVPVGPLAPWTTFDEGELRTWPGESRETTVAVLVPPGTAPAAGLSEAGVMAIGGDGTWAESRVPVDVAPRPQVVLHTPDPHAVRTCRRAQVHLAVANDGNTPLQVSLEARDREGALVQDSPRRTTPLGLGPGQAFTVPLVLRCTRPAWFGRAVPRDYVVEATAGQVGASSGGVLVQEPVVRVWWLLVLAGLVALVRPAAEIDGAVAALLVLAAVVWAFVCVVLVLVRYARIGRGAPRGRHRPPRPPA